MRNLRHLTLHGNPCSKITGFRKHIIENIPTLYCLDEYIVSDFERKDMMDLYPKSIFNKEKMAEFKRFRPYNFEM
jgi:hypothetical protein